MLCRHIDRGHAVLLIHCENDTKRTVAKGVILQNIQAERNADTVVSTQAGPIRTENFSIVDDFDRVTKGVKRDALGCHTDHVHVRLKDDARGCLASGGGGLFNNDVTQAVFCNCKAMVLCPLEEIGPDLLLVVGWMGNFANLIKLLQDDIQG